MTASVIIARDVTDAMLLSCSVPEPDAGEVAWVSGTTYALGARVFRQTTHRIYERAAAGGGTTPPEDDPVNWFEVGPTNRWAALDDKVGTRTLSASAPLSFTFAPGAIGGIGLFDLAGSQVTVQMLDRPGGVVVYSRTVALDVTEITSFYEWLFGDAGPQTRFDVVLTDLPAHWPDCVLSIAVGSQTSAGVGAIKFGPLFEIGETRFGASASIIDFSKKEKDAFGNWEVVEGDFARKATISVLVNAERFDIVYRSLAAVRARLAVWVASSDVRYAPLTVLGFFKDFSITADYATQSLCALEIEGVN
ncbi:MAG: hypothetical protein Fur0019_13180 [Tibeticola sp.]